MAQKCYCLQIVRVDKFVYREMRRSVFEDDVCGIYGACISSEPSFHGMAQNVLVCRLCVLTSLFTVKCAGQCSIMTFAAFMEHVAVCNHRICDFGAPVASSSSEFRAEFERPFRSYGRVNE